MSADNSLRERLRPLARDRRGVAALETLLVLPLQIFMMCIIVQLAHLIIAYQFTQYAAFAAARAVLVENTQTTRVGDMSPGDNAWKAAAHACSPMEIFSGDTGKWVTLPTGGKFRDGTFDRLGTDLVEVALKDYDRGSDGELQVEVTYHAHLPIPFANRVLYNAFEHSPRDLRVKLRVGAILAKPWE